MLAFFEKNYGNYTSNKVICQLLTIYLQECIILDMFLKYLSFTTGNIGRNFALGIVHSDTGT